MLPTYLYDETTPRFSHDAAILRLHQDCRGLRPSLQFLRDSQSARQIPLAAVRVGGRRGAATRCPRRAGDHAHRPGHDLLRRRPGPEGRAGTAARRAWPASRACAGCASFMRTPTESPAACLRRSRSTTTSASTSTSPAARIARRAEAHEARRRRRHFSQDSGQGAGRGPGHRPAHFVHRRLPRRVVRGFSDSGRVHQRSEI